MLPPEVLYAKSGRQLVAGLKEFRSQIADGLEGLGVAAQQAVRAAHLQAAARLVLSQAVTLGDVGAFLGQGQGLGNVEFAYELRQPAEDRAPHLGIMGGA